MSIIKYVTLQKIVAHDFRYDTRIKVHAIGMLDTKGYRHTFRINNNYWISTVTIVILTHPNVTFMCTLPLLFGK